jgi:NDP-sugar pyrophosphorylase family protein
VIVKAMVLAAGRGTRLGEVAAGRAKPMIPLAGKPILEHTLTWLGQAGVRDVVVNLHHRADQIRAHFGDGARFGVHITYSIEVSLLGTAGALMPWCDRFTSTFLVVYGDNFFVCDLKRLLGTHRRHGGLGTMALWAWPEVSQSGIARLDADDRIVEFSEKPLADGAVSPLINAGLLVWEPEVFRYIPTVPPADFSRDVVPQVLAAEERLYGYVMEDPELLLWIDRPEDYARAERELAARRAVS